MPNIRLTLIVCATLMIVLVQARDQSDAALLRTDVPVKLKEANVGDEPIGLNFLRVMTERFHADGTKARIVAIFHGAAG